MWKMLNQIAAWQYPLCTWMVHSFAFEQIVALQNGKTLNQMHKTFHSVKKREFYSHRTVCRNESVSTISCKFCNEIVLVRPWEYTYEISTLCILHLVGKAHMLACWIWLRPNKILFFISKLESEAFLDLHFSKWCSLQISVVFNMFPILLSLHHIFHQKIDITFRKRKKNLPLRTSTQMS